MNADPPSSDPTRANPPSFAVVIPAFNEEAGIRRCVEQVTSALARLPNRSQLIVVEDGSSDATPRLLRDLAAAEDRLVLVEHDVNRGYGAALKSGVVEAHARGFDYVVFMDSDLTNDPADLGRFAAEMAEGTDVIKASRYVRGGGALGVPKWRVVLSVVGNAVARFLFRLPVRDCTNGFRAVRTGLLAPLDLRESGFSIILEELYRLRPLASSYAEVPVILTNRAEGMRPSTFSYTPRSLASFLRYPLLSALESLPLSRRKDRRS